MGGLNESEVFLLVAVVAIALLLMSFDRPIRNAVRKIRRRIERARR